MRSLPPENLPAILFVDDEPKTCKHFKLLFSSRFRILTALDGRTGLEIFKSQPNDIGVIMTDQRMPHETGSEFLEKAALIKPSVKRILSTAYADVDAAIDAVNNSGIYRYITKPWDISELEMTLIRAMELFLVEREREVLLSQKITELAHLAAVERVRSLATLVVFRDSEIRHVATAVGALFELGNLRKPEINAGQWGLVFQNHRQFLDLAQACLPSTSEIDQTLDANRPVCATEFCAEAAKTIPALRLQPGTESEAPLPGPLDALMAHFLHLFDGLTSGLASSETIDLHLTSTGPVLTLPAAPLEQSLLPIFSAAAISEEELAPCLKTAAALFSWHHHGGQLQCSRKGETLTLRLSFIDSAAPQDPWQAFASDLIGNFNFWKRQT